MSILDKKSDEELSKHKSNFYLPNIINRGNINIKNSSCFFINIKKFSSFEGSYYFNGKDPLVNTALQIIDNNKLKAEDSYLFNYYKQFQPKTYGDVYKLKKTNKLHILESTNHFHPWIHLYPTNQFRAGLFGPKHITNVQHRLIRLKNLINNINKFGYKPSLNDIIEGYVLLKNNDHRFLITGGHHRVAVLTAFHMNNNSIYNKILVNYDNTRVKIRFVNENDVDKWPGVKSGYLSKHDALEMFNSYFN